MSQAIATLDRVCRLAGDASVRLRAVRSAATVHADDDDLLDVWLASLPMDEFERFLSGLADLR